MSRPANFPVAFCLCLKARYNAIRGFIVRERKLFEKEAINSQKAHSILVCCMCDMTSLGRGGGKGGKGVGLEKATTGSEQ